MRKFENVFINMFLSQFTLIIIKNINIINTIFYYILYIIFWNYEINNREIMKRNNDKHRTNILSYELSLIIIRYWDNWMQKKNKKKRI